MNTSKILKLVLLIIGIALFSCSSSQGEGNIEAKDGDVPKAVLKAFSQKYPNEKSPEWSVDAHGNHEAEFKKNGEKYRADFHKSGKWIETENSIKYDDLPDAVQHAIEEDYDKDDITEIESVDSAKKGRFFDVEFKQKGKNHDVEFNYQGVVIGETNK